MALPQNALPPSANTAVAVYTVPANMRAAVTINVAAILRTTVKLSIAPPAGNLSNAMLIESGQLLEIGGVLERTGIVLPAGYRVFAATDVANAAAVNVWGIEETA